MDKEEARRLLMGTVKQLRARSRSQLERLLGNPEVSEVRGDSGKPYQVEAEAVWDDKKGHDLRIFVSIDDGGLRAFAPLSESFIVAPDGSFVGE